MLWHPKATRNSAVSQTDRATLCVIEYFAKSLKVTQEHSKWHRWVRYKLLFHCNYVCISYRFCDIPRQRMAWLWNWGLGLGVVQGHWKWRHSIDYIRLVGYRKYSSILYHFRVIWRSLKIIHSCTIRKIGCSFLFAIYSNYSSILHHIRDTKN